MLSVWGVDVAAGKVAACALDAGDATLRTCQAGGEGAVRLAVLDRQASVMVSELAGECPPLIVFVEQPVGRFPRPTLMAAWGVTLAVLCRELEGLYEHPVSIVNVTPPEWKKAAGLGGNAGKDDVMGLARELGYAGDDQDCADALVIASAGRAMTRQ